MNDPVSCVFCGRKADYLCDYVLGYQRDESRGGQLIVTDPDHAATFTCDAPHCDKCSQQAGMVFISSEDRSESDSVNFCPVHRDRTIRVPVAHKLITPEIAEQKRQRDWKSRGAVPPTIEFPTLRTRDEQ